MNESKPSRLKPVASLSRHRSCVVGPLARSGGPLFSFRRGRGRLTSAISEASSSAAPVAPEASGVPVPVRRVPLSLAFKAYRLPHPGQPPFPARPSGRGVRRPVAGPWGTMRGAVARAVRAARVHARRSARATARSPLPVPRRRSEIDRGRCRAIITQFLAARWRAGAERRRFVHDDFYRCRMPISNFATRLHGPIVLLRRPGGQPPCPFPEPIARGKRNFTYPPRSLIGSPGCRSR